MIVRLIKDMLTNHNHTANKSVMHIYEISELRIETNNLPLIRKCGLYYYAIVCLIICITKEFPHKLQQQGNLLVLNIFPDIK